MKRLDLHVADSAWDRLHDLALFLEKFHSDERIEVFMKKKRFEYRRWVVGHVKIVYRVTRTSSRVSDFFDGRQDPSKMKS